MQTGEDATHEFVRTDRTPTQPLSIFSYRATVYLACQPVGILICTRLRLHPSPIFYIYRLLQLIHENALVGFYLFEVALYMVALEKSGSRLLPPFQGWNRGVLSYENHSLLDHVRVRSIGV